MTALERFALAGALGGALAGAQVCSRAAARALDRQDREDRLAAAPRLEGVRPYAILAAATGFRALAADLVWIESVQCFGGITVGGGEARRYGGLAREALTLSPRWTRAREYAAIALAWVLNRPSEASLLLRAGLVHEPGRRSYVVLLAGLAATKAQDDGAVVAAMEELAREEGHPILVDRTLAFLYERQGRRDEAIAAWRRVLRLAGDPNSMRTARERLRALGAATAD